MFTMFLYKILGLKYFNSEPKLAIYQAIIFVLDFLGQTPMWELKNFCNVTKAPSTFQLSAWRRVQILNITNLQLVVTEISFSDLFHCSSKMVLVTFLESGDQ